MSITSKPEPGLTALQQGRMELQTAQRLLQENRPQGFAALNALFRAGRVPEPALSGRYAGKFVVIDIAPVLTQFAEGLADVWMPWKGKTFNQTQARGDNVLTRNSYLIARLLAPLYRGFRPDTANTYRAFAFRTYIGPGLMDSDRSVLKIDYDLKENPALTVRRVLDELMQIGDHLYLGKAHVHWWWGHWQTFAYFTLTDELESI